MQDLTNAVAAVLDRIIKSDTIEKAIESQLTKTIQREVESALSSYSDFGKQLDTAIKGALQVDFSGLGLPGYNDMILKIVRAQVDANVNSLLAKQVEEQLTELLAPPPAEIKLSELVEQFKQAQRDKRSYSCSCDSEQITLIVEETSHGSRFIYLDADAHQGKYDCAIRFLVSDHDNQIHALKVDGRDMEKQLFVGSLYNFERSLFQLYAAGTKLIVDCDEHSISLDYSEYAD